MTTKPKRIRWILPAAITAALLGGVAGGIITHHDSAPPKPIVASAPAVAPVPAPSSSSYTPTPDDFSAKVKVVSQSCFGSAGCDVIYQLDPVNYSGSPYDGLVDVTFSVTGMQDGPRIETLTIPSNGSFQQDQQAVMTSSPHAKFKVTVTDVTPDGQ